MSNYHRQRIGGRTPAPSGASFAVGERVLIVRAPGSYGYNGRAGVVQAVDGTQITLLVDEHPTDIHCSIFYAEELEHERKP